MAKSTIQAHEVNPFQISSALQVSNRRAVQEFREVKSGATYHLTSPGRSVDTEPFIKLFHPALVVLGELSTNPSLKLFFYICSVIKPNQNAISIDVEEAIRSCQFKNSTTYRRALNGLLKANMLAKRASYDRGYFINANYFFNGYRRKYMRLESQVFPAATKTGRLLPLTDKQAS
jgi:hypothetical protein